MRTIESIKGRLNARRALIAVAAVLLLTVSAVLVYDSSRAEGGGDGSADDTAREVIVKEYDTSGKPSKFIDADGDAKLIYTVVSDTDGERSVKITDMERDPAGTAYTTFPDTVAYSGTVYDVIGNKVVATSETDVYIDDLQDTDFKLKYKLDTTAKTATVCGYENGESDACSVVIPYKISINGTDYFVGGGKGGVLHQATIKDLTVIVPSVTDVAKYRLNSGFMMYNGTLESLKFIVDNDDPSYTAYDKNKPINIRNAFEGCTALKDVTLPNVVYDMFQVFEGCTSLGAGATPENPFVFNTRATNDLSEAFDCCTGIKYLELGKNVNNIDTTFASATNIEIIYNMSSLGEGDIAAAIVKSGSYNVLLFMLGEEGELTRGASIEEISSGDSSENAGRSWNITMPEATFGGVEIPSWTHKDNTARFDSGIDYDSFSPWGSGNLHSYYYYPLYGICTVTYNIITGGKTVETATQDVVCMYNTQLYDETKFSDTYREAIKNNGTWRLTDSTDSDATYKLGQSVTLSTNLLLCMSLDDNYNTDVTVTINWTFISDSKVKTYTYQKTYSGSDRSDGKIKLPELTEFQNNAREGSTGGGIPTTIKDYVNNNGVVSNGEIIVLGKYITAFCDFTITLFHVTTSEQFEKLRFFSNDDNGVERDLAWYKDAGLVVVPLNTFKYKEESGVTHHFLYWSDAANGTGNKYYPGDRIDPYSTTTSFYAIWGPISETEPVSVEYNLYDEGSGYKSETKTYTYGDITNLPTYTRDGYVLIGWSYTPIQNVNFSLDVPVTMTNDLRLYAVWAKIAGESPTVIVDNLVYSVDEVPSGDYNPGFLFIGEFTKGDKVKLTITFMKGESEIDKPTETGIYIMKIGYQVYRNGTDVTKEYYSDYDGSTPVTKNCYDGFLTIYNGNSSSVIA